MSSTTSPAQVPSPALIFETLNAYQRTLALRAAIELDLFTAIAEGNTTAKRIAARIRASERGTRVLCDFLTVAGFLTKQGDDYYLTLDSSVFLNRHSQAYLGSVTRFFAEMQQQTGTFDNVAAAIRSGATTIRPEGIMGPEDPIWVGFARSMAPMMAMPAQLLAQMLSADSGERWRVLDIAAGHGLFGITIAKSNPNAEVVAVDWAPVLDVARENAARAEVSERFSTIPGSALDVELGGGYDVVLITNFLQLLGVETIERLLRKVHAALAPAGRVVTLGFIPNEDRVSPATDASFSLMMLASTAEGDAYTYAEHERMFRNAGFSRSELQRLSPTPQRVIVSYK
jgi:ubiquinone/menaquinone biosynthesis C-methylase UbiE